MMIRKPVGKPAGGGDALFEEEVFFNPEIRPISGSAYEDYVELEDEPGDRVVYRVPYSPWFEGMTSGSQWQVHVFETVNNDFQLNNVIQVQIVGRMLELFLEKAVPELPKIELLPPVLLMNGRALLMNGREVRW